jgi:hypothetical protein
VNDRFRRDIESHSSCKSFHACDLGSRRRDICQSRGLLSQGTLAGGSSHSRSWGGTNCVRPWTIVWCNPSSRRDRGSPGLCRNVGASPD